MVTKRERLEAAIRGELADRPAVALWRHFPVDDQDPDSISEAHIRFQKTFDFDFLKVTPASSYCLRDWGVEDQWQGNFYGTRAYTKRVVHEPEDWDQLEVLNPAEGQLGMMRTALEKIIQSSQGAYPVLQTIFSPTAQAKNLAGNDLLLEHLRKFPEAVRNGLETITRTTIQFIEAIKAIGVDGIFYAVQHASFRYFDEASYQKLIEPFDQRVTAAADDCWLNVLHLHGEAIMFDLASRLPCQIVNWHDQETWPSLEEARAIYRGGLCGGLRRWETLVVGNPEGVRAETQRAVRALSGKGFVLGAGCVTPLIAPAANMMAASDALNAHSH